MGGAAYIIEGEVSAERLKAIPSKRSRLSRILARKGQASARQVNVGDCELIDISCSELKPLKSRFRAFLEEQIQKPSSSTQAFLDYLDLKVMNIYVRKELSKTRAERSYIQFSFSGCAGMAETSAELGRHWVELWYSRSRLSIIKEYLSPFGFFPKETQPIGSRVTFLPVSDVGHAAYSHGQFELDASVCEDENPEQMVKQFSAFATLMHDGNCRCQLCAPEFKPVELESHY
jgi:hypothetical protein